MNNDHLVSKIEKLVSVFRPLANTNEQREALAEADLLVRQLRDQSGRPADSSAAGQSDGENETDGLQTPRTSGGAYDRGRGSEGDPTYGEPQR